MLAWMRRNSETIPAAIAASVLMIVAVWVHFPDIRAEARGGVSAADYDAGAMLSAADYSEAPYPEEPAATEVEPPGDQVPEPESPYCEVGLDDVPDPPRFEDYPPARPVAEPTRPILDTPLAREYRTVLRDAAADGADFGGRYAIAEWGCGSPCYRWAIIDLRSGRVHFPPREIFMRFGPTHVTESMLTYRADSRLIVFAGMSHTFGEPDGRTDIWYETISYLEMTPRGLRPIRVVPVDDLCPEGTTSDLPLRRSPYSR